MIRQLSLIVCVTVGVSGCSENFVSAKLSIPAFQKSTEAPKVARPGVQIAVVPLGYSELESGNIPTIKAKWQEIDESQVAARGKQRSTSMHEANLTLIPLPSFGVAIENHSPAPIDLSKATVTLASSSGKKYSAMLNPEDIAARVDVMVRDRYPYAVQQQGLMEQVRAAVVRVPFLAKSTVVAPEGRFEGVLVFDMKIYDFKELEAALAGETKFEIALDNLGGDAQPFGMKVALGTTHATITASCAEGKPPTAQTCHFAK